MEDSFLNNKKDEKKFDKLVRDKIPSIIEETGYKVEYRNISSDEEFLEYLAKKLVEESKEFSQDHQLAELADILEIIYTILDLKNLDLDSIETLRALKKQERGAFNNRIILLSKSRN